VFAEAQAQVAAERIADRLAGREPKATYPGEGYCFLEMGKGQAMLVRGNFMAEPAPQVELTEPSAEHLAAKERFEAERLERWFGAG
jgi:sulfide:quinone oxidoreductase